MKPTVDEIEEALEAFLVDIQSREKHPHMNVMFREGCRETAQGILDMIREEDEENLEHSQG
jgi:hypothetical protein